MAPVSPSQVLPPEEIPSPQAPGPRLVRRSLIAFTLLSILALAAIFVWSGNRLTTQVLATIDWRWLIAGIALASCDWWGGGLRLWVVTRHLYARTPLGGMVVAGGLNVWGANLTPTQTGGGPVMIWAMHRFGVPLPEAMAAGLAGFMATVIFLTVAGPTALALGAGRSLADHGIAFGVTMLDLFRASVSTFMWIGVGVVVIVAWPSRATRLTEPLAQVIARRWPRMNPQIQALLAGSGRLRACVRAFVNPRGLLALLAAVASTPICYLNKFLAGYFALRALHIEAPFGEVIAMQVLLTFLLYFAPSPGGAGIAEVVGAFAMKMYVPSELMPLYAAVWRLFVSYLPVAAGFIAFGSILRSSSRALREASSKEHTHDAAA